MDALRFKCPECATPLEAVASIDDIDISRDVGGRVTSLRVQASGVVRHLCPPAPRSTPKEKP